jgi:hypothetical protein
MNNVSIIEARSQKTEDRRQKTELHDLLSQVPECKNYTGVPATRTPEHQSTRAPVKIPLYPPLSPLSRGVKGCVGEAKRGI